MSLKDFTDFLLRRQNLLPICSSYSQGLWFSRKLHELYFYTWICQDFLRLSSWQGLYHHDLKCTRIKQDYWMSSFDSVFFLCFYECRVYGLLRRRACKMEMVTMGNLTHLETQMQASTSVQQKFTLSHWLLALFPLLRMYIDYGPSLLNF